MGGVSLPLVPHLTPFPLASSEHVAGATKGRALTDTAAVTAPSASAGDRAEGGGGAPGRTRGCRLIQPPLRRVGLLGPEPATTASAHLLFGDERSFPRAEPGTAS